MKRIKLEIAYDGTAYCGWQLQPGQPTVEELLNKTLSKLLGEEITVIGASRTDSGVHAIGNVAVFDTENRMSAENIRPAINQRLPEDIRVQNSIEVSPNFHPRRVPSIKTYEYRILNRKVALPTERLYTNFIYYDLDLSLMQAAAAYLVGEHDFRSFCSVKTKAMDTVRTIKRLEVTKSGDIITISVSGNGFLYNMIRIIAGTLMKVGRGSYPPEKIVDILKGLNRGLAGPTALPHGLTLVKIEYSDNDMFS
ncbi:MAG: truA [Herbinix sp.]|jgi:tRNA pseudouridine38-40 synthase|nr:truA [Herbinix sp.]